MTLENTGNAAAEKLLKALAGRWKLAIVVVLFGREKVRFLQLHRILAPISERMLGRQLLALQRDGIVGRREFDEIPRRVEYFLTPFGESLEPIVVALYQVAKIEPEVRLAMHTLG